MMIYTTLRKLMEILTPRERRGFYLLVLLTLGTGLLETVGVASVLPFMAVLAEPERIETSTPLSLLYNGLGFTSTQDFLIFLGVGTFLMVMTAIVGQILAVYAIVRFSSMRAYTIGCRLLRGYLHQPYAWFLNRHSAELGKAVLSEVDSVVVHCFIPAMKVIANTFVAAFITTLLVVLRPWVALGTAAVLLTSYLAIFMTAKKYNIHFGQMRFKANGERYRIAQEATGGIKDVKLLGLEDSYVRRFRVPAYRMARANAFKTVVADAPRYLLQGVAFGGMLMLILILLISGSGSLGSILPVLAVYAFAGLRLLPALQTMYQQLSAIQFHQTALDALHSDLREFQAEGEMEGERRVEPIHLREKLEIVDMHYSYPRADRAALRGLSLTIPARTTVGIIGGTGAGKTTAVDLMLGLLTPQEGELRVDGMPIGRSDLRAWQNAIGYVPQQIFLTDDTVTANIAFGLPPERIDHAAVERAARIAELHDFVMRELPQGYDTLVGERGVRLSGGQRQRIGIARALYNDPDVLIMDEATSALDNLTERAVMDAVHNLGHDKTIILIAHRLSTVQECDTIFMLEHGQLIAQGTYDDLLGTSRQFRAMAVGKPVA